MKTRKRKKRKRSPLGRLLEVLGTVTLVLVVLAFGVSIAARFGGAETTIRRTSLETVESTRDETYGSDLSGPAVGRSETNRPAPAAAPPGLHPFLVDVRNGCGVQGLAEEMTRRLRRGGFDVVEYKNADRYDYRETQIRYRAGMAAEARILGDWLRAEYGVGVVASQPMPKLSTDVLLVLGTDVADTLGRRGARAPR